MTKGLLRGFGYVAIETTQQGPPAAVIRLILRRRSLESVPRITSPARARPDIRRVRSESRVTIRVPISVQDSPSRPAAQRIRRTLYCDGESRAAAVTALDRSAASHAARTSAISTSSSSESRIAIAAAGVGTDMGDNYSSRGVLSSTQVQRRTARLSARRSESGWRDLTRPPATRRATRVVVRADWKTAECVYRKRPAPAQTPCRRANLGLRSATLQAAERVALAPRRCAVTRA